MIVLLRPVTYLSTVGGEVAPYSMVTFTKPSQAQHGAQSSVAGSNPALSAITKVDFGTKSQAVQKERADPSVRRTQ